MKVVSVMSAIPNLMKIATLTNQLRARPGVDNLLVRLGAFLKELESYNQPRIIAEVQ